MTTMSIRRLAQEYLGLTTPLSLKRDIFGMGYRRTLPTTSLRTRLQHLREACTRSQHPFMSKYCSSMHEDSYASDVSQETAPMSPSVRWHDFRYGQVAGMCPTLVFDSKGRAITIGVKLTRSEIMRINPHNLQVMSRHSVPRRPWTMVKFLQDANQLFRDTSGGAYLFVDHQDRIVVPTSNRDIRIFEQHEGDGGHQFRLAKTIELARYIARDDTLTTTLPDWKRAGRYWFTSRNGIVGVADTTRDTVAICNLRDQYAADEEIQNSFAVGPEGAFIVSDYALYRFDILDSGVLFPVWRRTYERGEAKPGQIGPGSGTTPTLIGNKFVAIGDNAEVMNVCVFTRDDKGSPVGRLPVFTSAGSACENSFIAYKNSLVVCNTYGYISPFDPNSGVQSGLALVGVDPTTGECYLRWHRDINILSTVPKLSAAHDLIYAYTKTVIGGQEWWAILGIRFADGEQVLTIPIARPEMKEVLDKQYDTYDNGWGPLFIGLNQWGSRSIFVGMISGLLHVIEQ